MIKRPRTSTVVIATIFALTLILYLAVRPDPAPPARALPAAEVPAARERQEPADTTTTRGRPLTTASPTETLVPGTTEEAELPQALRAGGYVIYFRHGATDDTSDTETAGRGRAYPRGGARGVRDRLRRPPHRDRVPAARADTRRA